ncbi:MAG TPA: hypothetical protein DIT95_15835, partial [Arenibacter sp.]|nr:hypothetical protein [Arenibacter sp.]
MKSKTLLQLVFNMALFISTAIVGAQNAYNPMELKEDFQLFTTALEEAHPGIYRYETKSSMDGSFEAIEKELHQPLNQQEFYK